MFSTSLAGRSSAHVTIRIKATSFCKEALRFRSASSFRYGIRSILPFVAFVHAAAFPGAFRATAHGQQLQRRQLDADLDVPVAVGKIGDLDLVVLFVSHEKSSI